MKKNNPNLIVKSAYTFFESILKVEQIINFAKNNHFTNVSIVEKNVLYSAMPFYFLAKKANLKPIIGLEIDYNEIKKIIFPKNEEGYYLMIKISSLINSKKDLDAKIIDNDNLIVLNKNNLPIHNYCNKEDLDSLLFFQNVGNKRDLQNNFLYSSRESFKKDFSEEKLMLIDKIIDLIDLKINPKLVNLPNAVDNLQVLDIEKYFIKKLNDKLTLLIKNKKIKNKKIYQERLNYEISIIKKMGFINYFLIVGDIVDWAKKNNIFVGPGRGSSAGSLIAYLLNITNIDPIQNNLYFERFLNAARITMPDIDIDFEDTRRDEVINYVVTKYGIDYTASIITFQTLKAKSSFKDAARSLSIPNTFANKITKLIPDNENLENSYKNISSFRKIIDNDLLARKAFEIAKNIEGLPRQFSTHAAGIVISNKPIKEIVPIQSGYHQNMLQTQYPMDFLEYNGLLKIDLLGLRNLSFLHNIIDLIYVIDKNKIDLEKDINYNDSNVFKLLQNGLTLGIFQLETSGMTDILKRMKPTTFEDIVAVTSLFRPGPYKQIPSFINRKNVKEPIIYLDKILEPILKPTYGIIVYQEQIMSIVQQYAGLTLEQADILRRAISKKNHIEIKKYKNLFLSSAEKLNRNKKTSEEVFSLIYEFSNYGFNRSHAFAYSIISYQLAWLKAYYPLEFMTSLLNSVSASETKIMYILKELEKMNVKVNLPDINNLAVDEFILNKKERLIIIPINQIKGIGGIAIKNYKSYLENKPFKDYYDFVAQSLSMKISKNNIENLIKSGALDNFNLSRNTMLYNLNDLYEYFELIAVEKDNKKSYNYSLAKLPELEILPKDSYDKFELEVFGYYINEHPFKVKKDFIKQNYQYKSISDINFEKDSKIDTIAAVINKKESFHNGKKIAEINFEDDISELTALLPSNIFFEEYEKIIPGKIYKIKGRNNFKKQGKIIIEEIELLKIN